MPIYPSPGRGAWRLTGGLLPPRPGSTSKVGYYRLAGKGEQPVGASFYNSTETSHHAHVVFLGVKAIQTLVGAESDGWFGPVTDAKVREAQARWGVEADGIVGKATMKAGLTSLIRDVSIANRVPLHILGGLITHESDLDPAAVGVNGADHGLAQINLAVHGAEVSLERALDPDYAIHWTAEDLWMVYRAWAGKTKADPWAIAVAHHNSPLLSRKWATAGTPPYVEGRVFQIAEYVDKVMSAWRT
jgi:hypothetical protein